MFFANVELPSHLLYSFIACPMDMEHGQTPTLPQPSRGSEFTMCPALFPLLFLYKFIYLFLTVPGLRCCTGFSLVVGSEGYSLVVVLRLLTVAASLVAEHRLWSTQASVVVGHGLSSRGSWALEHRLNRCGAQA